VKLLGAIIAGGGSRRFGGDKAAAWLGGRALIEHVRDALAPQVDAMVVSGREWPGLDSVADRPAPDLGPLGGLCALLHYAAQHNYDAVLMAGCDVLPVPDLRVLVGPTAAVVKNHWLFGYWPANLAAQLDRHLATQSDHSMRHWITSTAAREVTCHTTLHNLNTREDFALYCAAEGLAA
jgi:molybdenum cofactor guanylyltransferase